MTYVTFVNKMCHFHERLLRSFKLVLSEFVLHVLGTFKVELDREKLKTKKPPKNTNVNLN